MCPNSPIILNFDLNEILMKKVIQFSLTISPYVKTLGNQINAPLFVKDFPMVPIAQQDVFWFWETST